MDLVREVLKKIKADENPGTWVDDMSIPGWTSDQISYHIEKLSEAGLINAENVTAQNDYCWKAIDLTWEGHEFLDTVENETVWKRLKAKLQEKGGAASYEVIKALAVQISKKYFLDLD